MNFSIHKAIVWGLVQVFLVHSFVIADASLSQAAADELICDKYGPGTEVEGVTRCVNDARAAVGPDYALHCYQFYEDFYSPSYRTFGEYSCKSLSEAIQKTRHTDRELYPWIGCLEFNDRNWILHDIAVTCLPSYNRYVLKYRNDLSLLLPTNCTEAKQVFAYVSQSTISGSVTREGNRQVFKRSDHPIVAGRKILARYGRTPREACDGEDKYITAIKQDLRNYQTWGGGDVNPTKDMLAYLDGTYRADTSSVSAESSELDEISKPAKNPRTGTQELEADEGSASIFGVRFFVFVSIVIVVSLLPSLALLFMNANSKKIGRKLGVFFLRIAFQFHPASIVSAIVGIILPILFLLASIGISIGIMYLIASGLQLPRPMASALFANFVAVAITVVVNFVLGIRRQFRLKAMFDGAVETLTKGEQMGKELFAEAVVRNFVIIFVLVIATTSAISASATYLGITALFSGAGVELSFEQYRIFFSYFANLIFQLLTFEIPNAFGFKFGPDSLPGNQNLLIFYTTFVKIVTIGGIIELIRSMWQDLRIIYGEVDVTLEDHFNAQGQDYSDKIVLPRTKLRFDMKSPTFFITSFTSKRGLN